MKFLIDTNILIPLEPTTGSDIEDNTPSTIEFARLVSESKSQLYVHPVIKIDIQQDTNQERKKLRKLLFKKYPQLPNPPPISSNIESILGIVVPNTNDWVDHHLIAALEANAIDFFVTEDRKIHKKAIRLNLQHRVATVDEALQIVQGLFEVVPAPPPAIQNVKAHELKESDPIFQSLRTDYPGFDNWLIKCKQEHRHAWVVKLQENSLAGVCIIKREDNAFQLSGKTLKLCCFKVSEQYNGFRFGELILKAIFTYAASNKYDWLYITVFDKHGHLIDFLEDFGFSDIGLRTQFGEVVLAKPMTFSKEDCQNMEPLEFSIRYGPFVVKFDSVENFIVPIRPEYHKLLFPEHEKQISLWWKPTPFGNSIRKAYLSNSLTRKIKKGDNLIFYRSRDVMGVTGIGIVEDVLVSSSAIKVAQFVGKRTVYRFEQIQNMCKQNVLAILFRQSKILKKPIQLDNIMRNKALSGPPQSITTLSVGGTKWLQAQLAE